MQDLITVIRPELQDLLDPAAQLETIAEGLLFTEGPVWDARAGRLLFSDIPANTIYAWNEADGLSVFRQPSGFANGLTFNRNGELIACEHRTRAITQSRGDGAAQALADSYQGKKLNSPNDLIAARDGSILFSDPIYGLQDGNGGPAEAELDFQGLFRYEPATQTLHLLSDSFERPNGLALSPDEKRLYVIDTVRQHIRLYEIGAGWHLSGGRIWAELWDSVLPNRPDGLKLDAHGNVFSTGPGGLWVFNPQADLLGRVNLPGKTSNLAWGGPGLDTLYITCSDRILRLRTCTLGLPLVD